MLRNGILPVPSERSPTGRWYVLVPGQRFGQSAIYARARRGRFHEETMNLQIADVSKWAATRKKTVFTVVKEIADPLIDPLPRLARLLTDTNISEILVHNPDVVGIGRYQLLIAALTPQQRALTAIYPVNREDDVEDAIRNLVEHMF